MQLFNIWKVKSHFSNVKSSLHSVLTFQLLSVRRPFVEIIVGDEDAITGPLYDVTKVRGEWVGVVKI